MNENSGGITGLGLLGIVFVTLNFVGLLIGLGYGFTMPFWIGLAIFAGILVIGLIVLMIVTR